MKKLLKWLAVASLALPVSVLPAVAQDYTIKVASSTANDVISHWMETFKAGVEEGSDGRIAVELYPANQLGQVPATIEGVSFGTIEVTVPASGFFVPMDSRFEVLDTPSLFDDLAHAQRVLADPEVAAQNRLIDGLMAGTSVYPALRFYDVATDMTMLPSSYAFATAVASKSFMDGLDDDLRALVREQALSAAEAANAWNREAVVRGLETWRENGGKVLEWTAEENAQYLANIEANLPEILEANPALGAEIEFMRAAAERLAE